ncbi:MAG TPA: efflux RND transporter periplasmic adaptor subunit [Candidatus Didemnitutus sp.]|nr:efflux RND transporter periplasmic adaptor subunit [Candidatus Didemnitutus sp.]
MKYHFKELALALVALAIVSGCHRDRTKASLAPKSIKAHVVRSQQVPVEVIASGAIEAVDKTDIAFQVPGRITSVEADDGMLVKKGQVLARLDPADYQKNLAIAEAQLDEIKARHSRLARMHEAGSLTAADFDKIDAALKQAQSAAELARRQVGYTELSAPFDGWIVKRGIAAGMVAAPAVPVFSVFSPGAVWANLGVSETEIAKVRIGQTAEVRVAAAHASPQRGVVEAILPNAEMLSRAFTVKVRLENTAGDLRHGNVIVGHISTGETRRAVTVPPQVVQKNPDGSLFVWLIDAARHTAVRQLVEVGALRSSEIEIASGLSDGDQVVLNVPHTLFEGAQLSIAGTP